MAFFLRKVFLLALAGTTFAASNSSGLQSPNTGNARWDAAIAKAQALVNQMTDIELNNLTYGFSANTGCSGVSGSIPRLNFSGLCLNDGPAGVRNADLVSAFASGVSVAASFNRSLAYQRSLYMGAEAKREGVQALNGPVVGPLGRIATDGRAWEGFGADPYLAGQLGAVTVQGLQENVIAVVKHFILNEQETDRYSFVGLAISEDADDQTLHELYVTPFQDAVRAGAAAVMCAYNRVNGTYSCENARNLNQILKTELAFPGFVVSDWTEGQKSGVKSAVNGLDLAMPNSPYWDNDALANAVSAGTLSKARLQDMARRILSSWFLLTGPESGSPSPGHGLPYDLLEPHELVDAQDPASKESILQSAIEGHVLVKNTNNALPLKNVKLMSVFGWDAALPPIFDPVSQALYSSSKFANGLESVDTNPAAIIANALAPGPSLGEPDIGTLGTLTGGAGSGSNIAAYWTSPLSAIAARAKKDGTFLWWDTQSISPNVAASSQVCLVFLNQESSETIDRTSLTDGPSDQLVNNVASKCNNTIVIIHNAWIRTVDAWIENPNVTAVIYAHLPGQDSGEALVDLLYGNISPSGRLPYTVAKSESDYGDLLHASAIGIDPHAVFTERLNIDYRHFLAGNIEPRFPFGYGLTYSTFNYTTPTAKRSNATRTTIAPNQNATTPGGITSLFDTIATVSVAISNTGNVLASEVSQLYVQFSGDDTVRYLRGFSKDSIAPGATTTVSFALTRRDLSRWSTTAQQWILQEGEFTIYVGKDVLEAANRKVVLPMNEASL